MNISVSSHRTAVDAFFVNKQGKLLLSKRSKEIGGDQWSFVGGRVEKRENVIEALKREIREELGDSIRYEIKQVIAVRDNSLKPDNEPHLTIVFLVQYVEGQMQNREPEKCVELKWFPIDKLPDNLFSGVEKIASGFINNQVTTVIDYQ